MRIVRYAAGGAVHYGTPEDGETRIARLDGAPFGELRFTGDVDEMCDVRIVSPVESPRVFGFAYNYASHIEETAFAGPEIPVVFMKPSTAVIGPDEAIVYPRDAELVHFEGELAVVIGRRARSVSRSEAYDCVLGYTCGNDVSDRVIQRKESKSGALLIGKGYDTFAPLGPAVVTGLDPSGLALTTRVNGTVLQSANTKDLLLDVPGVISYLSRCITLLPGDVIMTGTPAGVGPVKPGDRIEVEIEGIGVLRNPVIAES